MVAVRILLMEILYLTANCTLIGLDKVDLEKDLFLNVHLSMFITLENIMMTINIKTRNCLIIRQARKVTPLGKGCA